MLRALVLVVAIGCTHRADFGEPVDAARGNYRVATFNVRRYFDTVCASGACGSGEYEELPSQQAFDARATQLADALRALDADVVSLQELETQACLDAILARLPELPYGVLGEIGSTASVDVAVISKTPITLVVNHRATEPLELPDGTVTTFSRELLEVHVRDGAVAIFATHFKSKSNDDPARRLAEAQHASRIVNELAAREPATLVVLAGDLNDTPESPPLAALTVTGGLVRVAGDLATPDQATYVFDGRGQAIDHILIGPGTAALRVPRSSQVWRETSGWGGSDHAALTSDFTLP
ncbi:MAG: endonuclease/exonuclease/phosphatase family protein [Kofleriaceae bacterium]